MPALDDLTVIVAGGWQGNSNDVASHAENAIEGLFGERYRANSPHGRRIVLMAGDQNIPFAGLLNPDNPSSGVYGGMSLIWFPIADDDAGSACSLLTFVCGTRGFAPDESIMGRPGHARHLRAPRRRPAPRDRHPCLDEARSNELESGCS